MSHTVSGVNCDHTVKVGLGFFEKARGRLVIFSTVRILRQIKADRSSVDVKHGIVLVWKRRKIPGNRLHERVRTPHSVGIHTVRFHLGLPYNDHSGLKLVGLHSTILLATELIESGHELVMCNSQEWGPEALVNATVRPD